METKAPIKGINQLNKKYGKVSGDLPNALVEYLEELLKFAVYKAEAESKYPAYLVLRASNAVHLLTIEGEAGDWHPVSRVITNADLKNPGGYGGTGLWYYRKNRADTILDVQEQGGHITHVPNNIGKKCHVRLNPNCIVPMGLALGKNPMARILAATPWLYHS